MKKILVFILTGTALAQPTSTPIGQVFWTSRKGEITELVLQTSVELVPGLIVQIGEKEFAVVGPKQRQDNTGFYYEASIPDISTVKQGEPVYWVPIGEFNAPPGREKVQEVLIEIRRTIPFAPKRIGKITATEPPKVLLDKGSLHDVLRGDIFAVYDSTGRYKGQVEVRMIGDLQAVAYAQGKLQPQKGDRIVFMGQKKRLAMGMNFAVPRFPRELQGSLPAGGGLLVDLTFSRGWILEFNFGAYHAGFKQERVGRFSLVVRNAFFFLPITIRKNFFWPSNVSPYLGAGLSVFYRKVQDFNNFDGLSEDLRRSAGNVFLPMPTLQAGIEFFTGKFFRPRIEARYFFGPKVGGISSNSLFFGLGFTAGVGG